jgi:hypothetical protein
MAADYEGQYADTTQFVRNWGQYAQNIVRVESGLQQQGEQVAQTILRQRDKLYCFNCNIRNHVNSMCFVKSKKSLIRGRPRQEEDGWGGRSNREQGFVRSQSRNNRDRDRSRPQRQPLSLLVVAGPGMGDTGAGKAVGTQAASAVGDSVGTGEMSGQVLALQRRDC